MTFTRALLLAALLAPAFPAAATAGDDSPALGHMLSLVQVFMRLAAQDDSAAGLKAMDDVLAGRNPDVNRAAAGRVMFSPSPGGISTSRHRARSRPSSRFRRGRT